MQSAKSALVPRPINSIFFFCIIIKKMFQPLEYHVKCLFIECKAVLQILYFERHFKKQFLYQMTIQNYMKYWNLLDELHFLHTHNWKWRYGLVKL